MDYFIAVIPFLFLVLLNVRYQQKIILLINLVKINENELKALSGDYSAFPEGMEYLDYDHPFTYDLDIFGEASVFSIFKPYLYKRRCLDRLAVLKNPLLNYTKVY